jgi:nucleotide-binding universal stress UspA family protein
MTSKISQKILVPLDGSKNSLRGLNMALVLAKPAESSIIGLNVFSCPSVFRISSEIKNKIKKKSNNIVQQAEAISKKANVPFTGITKISNNVGNTIIVFAEKNGVDMIVIGSRGLDPELGMFLGSVANHVVIKSKIPVTVVK